MSPQVFDVIVVGAGPFACFSALLLACHDMKVALVFPENTRPMDSFLSSLNACWPSLNDPPTRADVAHGHEVATYLHSFCINGINFFINKILPLINEQNHNWQKAKCLRIGLKDFEKEELVKAEALEFGLKTTNHDGVYLESTQALLCIDKVDFKSSIIKTLENKGVTFIPYAATKLTETQSKCILELSNKKIVESEIIILGNNLEIAKLMPKFSKILIPMSDCLFEYECQANENSNFFPLCFRASNGHICGSILKDKNQILAKLSGPRFLLPGAGAGLNLTNTDVGEKTFKNLEKFHREIVFNVFSSELNFNSKKDFLNAFPLELKSKKIFADCYPCDELPLLGEYGKLGRVLGNTGWLATGFSAGAWAAKIICDLILQEKSSDLHTRLHPRRLFTSFSKKLA